MHTNVSKVRFFFYLLIDFISWWCNFYKRQHGYCRIYCCNQIKYSLAEDLDHHCKDCSLCYSPICFLFAQPRLTTPSCLSCSHVTCTRRHVVKLSVLWRWKLGEYGRAKWAASGLSACWPLRRLLHSIAQLTVPKCKGIYPERKQLSVCETGSVRLSAFNSWRTQCCMWRLSQECCLSYSCIGAC